MANSLSDTVSVIVPVYNIECYLPRCIESILKQSHPDLELILVDDGSSDGSGQICDRYAAQDPRVQVIHKANGGVSAARNTALEVFSGSYVAFCDSDDYWDPTFLERMLAALKSSDSDVVACNCLAVDEQDDTLWQTHHECGTVSFPDEQPRFDFLIHGLLGGRYGWEVWSRLFKAEPIRTHQIRFCLTCGNYAEDLGFVFQYSLHTSRSHSIPDRLYRYFIRSDSMMRTSTAKIKLEQVNELSWFLYPSYAQVFTRPDLVRAYCLIHFLIVVPEFRKSIAISQYRLLGQEIDKISRKDWYKKNLRALQRYYPMLKTIYGRPQALLALLHASYGTHGSWARFYLRSAFTQKILLRGESGYPS